MGAVLGLGLAALGRPGYINVGHGQDLNGQTSVENMEAGAHAVLDAARAGGIRYFDAARSYGLAERFLGSWLSARAIPAHGETIVASKWGYTYTADWRADAAVNEVKDLSLATLTRQLAESRALLGEHLDIYQIHSATIESGVLEDRAVLDELARLRESGLAIGLTVTGPRQSETIELALAVGGFYLVQATWNLMEQSAAGALAAAHAEGLHVVVKEALANGRLTSRGTAAQLLACAERRQVAPDALALAAALAAPWADVVLSGAVTVPMLQSNLAALDLQLTADELSEFGSLAIDPERYWEQRSALPWT
jgi:aryl-alcohol dehydrogenase-like predicted oxidoreductase